MSSQPSLFAPTPPIEQPTPDGGPSFADLLGLVVGPYRVLDCKRCGLRQKHTPLGKTRAQCSSCGEIRSGVDSHGDGRRMAMLGPEMARAEAVERRERMVERWGSVSAAQDYSEQLGGNWFRGPREWALDICLGRGLDSLDACPNGARTPGDVGIDSRGIPVAMCPDCRCAAVLDGGAS